MLNVIRFRKRAPISAGPGRRRPPADEDVKADIAELSSRVTVLKSKARSEIGNAILMLDLAAQHAREIADRLSDPSAKECFDEHISIIERLLELARDMSLKF
jgi:hypothetical protein